MVHGKLANQSARFIVAMLKKVGTPPPLPLIKPLRNEGVDTREVRSGLGKGISSK